VSHVAPGTDVRLERADARDAPRLAGLLESYVEELSPFFPAVRRGPDGRFGYAPLPLYWSEPDRRFAFLIHRGAHLAGFALATHGSPVAKDPAVHDIAEFFIEAAHRRAGVGRHAALALWDRFPGPWTVRVLEANATARRFWNETTLAFDPDTRESVQPGSAGTWRIFSFTSGKRTPPPSGTQAASSST
jgi:predicted acetyltransferase